MKRFIKNDWYKEPIPENVEIGEETDIYSSFIFSHYKSKKPLGFKIGHNSGIDKAILDIGTNGVVEIGDYCTLVEPIINTNKKIVIGNHVLTAFGTIITDSGFAIPPIENNVVEKKDETSIRIGNNVWIGFRALILEGADIGDNSIVGAGAIVNFKVPENSIVVGNPGRIIKTKK
jgi:acetyltransferase-like isoleucine patch superfamily enzyme